MKKRIWISWEDHRRSRELASVFGAKPMIKDLRASRAVRYLVLPWWTLAVLMSERPDVVFCQNPSIMLAAQLSLLKRLIGFQLVVDRHSNFKLPTRDSRSIKWRLFHAIGDYTLRAADLTIVTNTFLRELVEKSGGRAAVLQDKLPTLDYAQPRPMKNKFSIVFICTFSWDEPVKEVVNAAVSLDDDFHLFVTGRVKDRVISKQERDAISNRVTFTGFLSEKDYQSMLASADILMVLTTNEHTLLCGAYEAVSLGKPLVLSNTNALKEYFCRGAVYCDPSAQSISAAIVDAAARREELRRQVESLREELRLEWSARFEGIDALVREAELARCASPRSAA